MWSRGLISIRRSVATAVNEAAGIDDFLHTISSTPVTAPVKTRKTLESGNDFCKWLDKNPVKSVEQFIDAAEMATAVKSVDQKEAFSKLDHLATSVLPQFYEQFGPEQTVNALRFVLQFNPESKVSQDIQKLFIEKNIKPDDLNGVSFHTLIRIVRFSNDSVRPAVVNKIVEVINRRIENELSNPAELMALLASPGYDSSKWFHNAKFLSTAEKLIPVMGIPEMCSLLKHMAVLKQRNRQLIGAIVNAVSYSTQCLSVSQIVSLATSCATLNYFPPKMAKKISTDLEKNSNVLNKWENVMSIADAFVRMRMGDRKTWSLLVRWAVENEKEAKTHELSRLVSGLARIGEPAGKPLARALKPRLVRTKSGTPNDWLNTVYSLAYFQELDAVFADSVLNKFFVEQIMNSAMEMHDRLRKAMTLLMINSTTKVDLGGTYAGPTVNKETFAQFGIHFDAKTIRNARQLKYASRPSECDDLFLKSLFKLAPQDTHCRTPSVEECGAFVDAYVMPDEKNGLLVSTSQWGTAKPRPVFFYGWMQTKQNVTLEKNELPLLGPDQLALRLIRADGFDPVIVLKTDFEYSATDSDKVNMLRDKIHKKQSEK